MNGDRWYLQEKSPGDELHKLIEVFAHQGRLNKKPGMTEQEILGLIVK